MNEKQAFSIIRNVIKLEGVAKQAAIQSSKELRQAVSTVRELVRTLPEGSVERELAYKQLSALARATMERPTDTLQADTQATLLDEAPTQAEWARSYVNTEAGLNNEVQRAALQGVDQAKVADKPLGDVFKGLKSAQWKKVDNKVREGFLAGKTNSQIAKELVDITKGLIGQQKAVARTAVMSMAQQTHNAIWDANADVIEKWVFDASLDYRVCPVCAPLDGRKVDRRGDLPDTPIHPNCRCMVLPDTGIDTDTGARSYVELVKDKPKEGPGVRVYKQKVRGEDGKMYWKVARDTEKPITMAGFIRRANNKTQEQVLGKDRAARFRKLIKGTPGSKAPLSPEEALMRVTRDVPGAVPLRKTTPPKPAVKAKAPIKKKAAPKPAVKPPRKALKDYTGETYREIRAEEFRAAKKAGKKLTPFEEAQLDLYKPSKTYAKDASEIEAFLKRAPKHKGEVYRTMITDQKGLDDMLASFKSGKETFAMESWTADKKLDLAQGRGQRVMLRAKNKQGVDITTLSEFQEESEILMPKGVKYKLKGVTKKEISAWATKEGRYSWVIDLEQL